ncbi:putative NADH dehydrogenase [Calothrix sp. NIES-4071]|nr:putative NADH dehydrogenase [Calothrix sp. NIES-4071]BAZ55413.1 putative NADH dehydrogenase [Calothrix sp. NIES-4105]
MTRQRVVIVGAGFAGISAARALVNSSCEVLLVNRENYHTFVPLLHQVASCGLAPEHIVHPIRKIVKKYNNIKFITSEVNKIDLKSKIIEVNDCPITYDYLILACGSTSKYFGVPGAYEHSLTLKSLKDSVNIRNHLLSCFEVAAYEVRVSRRQQHLTFIIVGGGATGVEMAGEVASLVYGTLIKDYPSLDFGRVRVLLVHSGERLLPEMPPALSNYTARKLQQLGVEVQLNSRVTGVTENAVHLESHVIPCHTVIWTAGVQGDEKVNKWGLTTNRNNQVKVFSTLQVPEYPQVYAIGDLAALSDKQYKQLPMVAPVAVKQGITAANNILRQIKGQNPQPLHYRHQGSMVIIGRHAAVANIGQVKLTGFPAWFLWLVIHIGCLPGWSNRLHVLISWGWIYFLREYPVQLIFRQDNLVKYEDVALPNRDRMQGRE